MSSGARLAIIAESLRQAAAGIVANKLRSLLTVLGVVIGATTVIAMLAVVQGLNASVADAIRDMGTATFLVAKYPMTRNVSFEEYLKLQRSPDLTDDDARAIETGSPWVKQAAASLSGVFDVRAGRLEASNVVVKGLSSSFAEISDVKMAQGRVFTGQENARRNNVCIIGPTVARRLFPGLDSVGKHLTVGEHSFLVIGVLVERGKMFGQDMDSVVLMPYTAYTKAFGKGDAVLVLQAADTEHVPAALNDAITILRGIRGLRASDDNNFFTATQDALMSSYYKIMGGVYAVMVGVAAMSLLVGGVGIMNIMLVSVTERTQEIGLRKAMGATRALLILQFLSEAAGLSSLGGVIGLLFGAGLATLVASVSPIPARVVGWSIPVALIFAASVGILAGLYPALKAARLHPVEALRRE
ncbi:MAG: ABC transporter permease [Candidatus Eisenbacteria bacterium]|jgi:putative ABC transport system permease protein|nr:ABC transporter permease [Candidatus Eisenbacteria bacterium]